MLNIGDNVKILNTSLEGIITKITIKNSTKIYNIQINQKNVILGSEHIEKIKEKNCKNISSLPKYSFEYNNKFIPEITIRHQTLDIAMYNVEKFIENAIFEGVKDVKIIHGRNGGILRRAVHTYLKQNKNVENFRLGNYYEGSYGVTIIKLK